MAAVKVPEPIFTTSTNSEALPVYTEKKWLGDIDDVPRTNLKKEPTLAKIKLPSFVQSNGTNSTNVTILPDKEPTEKAVAQSFSEKNQTQGGTKEAKAEETTHKEISAKMKTESGVQNYTEEAKQEKPIAQSL